jgi:hypothetical protein
VDWIPNSYQDACLRVAKAQGYSVQSLANNVRALSDAYNTHGVGSAADHGAARLLFFFQRDVPKLGLAVRELLVAGLLGAGEGTLRVLDYGAGLGASTFGLMRALEEHGFQGKVESHFYEPDAKAASLARALAAALAAEHPGLQIKVHEAVPKFAKQFDLVLLGQVLSELHQDAPDRLARHEDFLRLLLREAVREDGSVVVVEPALRARSRHLQALGRRLRDHVFAPCLHQEECPLLVRERDWCHEDHDVNLPPWLVPTAKAAGLRYEGITYAYVVLRADRKNLSAFLPTPTPQRLVSDLRRTKGKIEALLCPGGNTMRLDRHRTEQNAVLEDVRRGNVLATPTPRVDAESVVQILC